MYIVTYVCLYAMVCVRCAMSVDLSRLNRLNVRAGMDFREVFRVGSRRAEDISLQVAYSTRRTRIVCSDHVSSVVFGDSRAYV